MSKATGSQKPVRMWIDGKCFNIKQFKNFKDFSPQTTGACEEISDTTNPESSAINTHKIIINSTGDGKLETTFRLPSVYYPRLNDFPDFSLKEMESATNTQVTIPKNHNDRYIIISGSNELDIVNAREIIHSVVSKIRDKQRALQFISIPVHTEEVQRNFQQFKQELLSGEPIKGMDETIFQSSLKLHLTVVVFALLNDFEKFEAVAALRDCKTKVIDPLIAETGPLKIKISGIDCMNENLQKVNVLYANAKFEHDSQENVLQKLANGISDYFYERGLAIQYRDNVKLHVTLINTRYRKTSAEVSPTKNRSRWHYPKKQAFDARSIMEKYKDYYFGESVFNTVHLSCMSSIDEDGFYKPMSKIII